MVKFTSFYASRQYAPFFFSFFFLTARCVGVGNLHIFRIFSEDLQNFEIPFR